MEKPTGVIQKIIESLQQVNALDVYSPIEKDIILHNLRAAYMIFLNTQANEESRENRVQEIIFKETDEEKQESEHIIQQPKYDEIKTETVEEKHDIPNEEFHRFSISIEHNDPTADNRTYREELPPVTENEEELPELPDVTEDEEELPELPDVTEYEEELPELPDVTEYEEELPELPDVTEDEEEFQELPDVIEYNEEFTEELPAATDTDEELPELPDVTEDDKFTERIIEDIRVTEKQPVAKAPFVDDILEFIPDAKPQSGLLFEDISILKTEKKSLNDLLTEKKEDHTLGARFQQSYIPDLTKAIAINEKFTFIRELFRNSGVDFSNAIQKLNECENIDAAFALMEELKHQYLWDTTSTSYLSLCDLVRRRFL
ncbi:MAG: hypothetical protein FWF70_04775 [Bacteroidetes bacterium]|nr:hypothetical protein [Bacteroidota bacterium]MCL1968783.1 hypothetical protein [Bacteroidota bacterium]